MKRICVFCGSSQGSLAEYGAAAEEMAAELVRRNIGLVYGGGNVGLMGTRYWTERSSSLRLRQEIQAVLRRGGGGLSHVFSLVDTSSLGGAIIEACEARFPE